MKFVFTSKSGSNLRWDVFKIQLTDLINSGSIDDELETPDYLLANYVIAVLRAHGETSKLNQEWHNHENK